MIISPRETLLREHERDEENKGPIKSSSRHDSTPARDSHQFLLRRCVVAVSGEASSKDNAISEWWRSVRNHLFAGGLILESSGSARTAPCETAEGPEFFGACYSRYVTGSLELTTAVEELACDIGFALGWTKYCKVIE